MDTITLVDNQIDDGQMLLDRLGEEDFAIRAAGWVKPVDEDRWSLYIATSEVDKKGLTAAYREVLRVLRSLENPWITGSDIKLIEEKHPITSGLLDILKRFGDRLPTHSQRNLLGDLAIEEVYVYPLGLTFKGFSETKRRFPSAEIFGLTVLAQRQRQGFETIRSLMGKVNAAEFEGKAPETVLFMGPKISTAETKGTLVFVYRPEGWNTFYRTETQSWEKVVYSATGKPIYEPADFGPLAAMTISEGNGVG